MIISFVNSLRFGYLLEYILAYDDGVTLVVLARGMRLWRNPIIFRKLPRECLGQANEAAFRGHAFKMTRRSRRDVVLIRVPVGASGAQAVAALRRRCLFRHEGG